MPEYEFNTINQPSSKGLQRIVVEDLGRQIISGLLRPGDSLPTEPELGNQFGVSRTSVREAMRILSTKGLIEIRQKIGTRVSDKENWNVFDSDILRWHHESGHGHDVMRDLIEMRQILEPEAAKLAAARASIDDHQNLQLALRQMLEEINSPDGYARADLDFHLSIYRASKNSLLWQFGTVVADFLKRVFMMQQQTVRENQDLLQDIELHEAVYEQISKGDGQGAEQTMLKLVLEGKRALIEALNAETRNSGSTP